MPRSGKGPKWERDIATQLSEWWEPGRSDIFWRVMGSGGRAKSRGRKGLTTYGQAGDIAAVDPCGSPFVEMFTVECKKGYSKSSPFDVIDRIKPLKPNKNNFDGWVEQVEESRVQAGSLYWLIIFKRDFRNPMVAFPHNLVKSPLWFSKDTRNLIAEATTANVCQEIAGVVRCIDFMPFDVFLVVLSAGDIIKAMKVKHAQDDRTKGLPKTLKPEH